MLLNPVQIRPALYEGGRKSVLWFYREAGKCPQHLLHLTLTVLLPGCFEGENLH